MNKLITKARSGVTLVELLVVILIVTILSVSLLPLLKPYIEQAKYAAEAQPTLANIQTKINLYQYEKDKLPCTLMGTDGKTETQQDDVVYSWMAETSSSGVNYARTFTNCVKRTGLTGTDAGTKTSFHLSQFVDVDWQDLTGKRMNPSHFQYHVIKGSGAAQYGYAVGIFGDGEGLSKGTGYAVLVLVDTAAKLKVVATWERYKPVNDTAVSFLASASGTYGKNDDFCHIPAFSELGGNDTDTNKPKTLSSYSMTLKRLRDSGWSFNFDDVTTAAQDNPVQ